MLPILLFLFIASFVFYNFQKPKELRFRLKDKSEDKKKIIEYFFGYRGCFSKRLTDNQFDDLVNNKIFNLKLLQKAIQKLGLDKSEINEVQPLVFNEYNFNKKGILVKKGNDLKWRSTLYQVTYIFFTNNNLAIYQINLNLEDDSKKEISEQFYFKDITAVSTLTETYEFTENKRKYFFDYYVLKLSLPGYDGGFMISFELNEEKEQAIQGMKSKLKEKKEF